MSTPQFRNLIAGEWVAGASVSINRNPSDLSDVIGEYAQADAAQTRTAVAAAKAAFPAWATGSIQERANILERAAAEILARKDEIGFFFNDTATTEIYTLTLHAALPI